MIPLWLYITIPSVFALLAVWFSVKFFNRIDRIEIKHKPYPTESELKSQNEQAAYVKYTSPKKKP